MNVCFYHRSDLDGHCCGAIYRKAVPESVLHGVEYGDPIRWDLIDSNDLTIMDWSFQPWSIFEEVSRRAASVVWIDHHKSAIEDWKSCSEIDFQAFRAVLDEKQAACELAWSLFFPHNCMPLAVHLLGRYDVWDHTEERILPFQYRMRMETTDPGKHASLSLWNVMFNSGSSWMIDRFVNEGHLLLNYQSRQDAREVNAIAFDLEWNDMRWLACNRTGKGSTFFEAKWDPRKYHGMMAFGWTGRHWRIGIYSDRSDVDCAEIAKANGGGGHKRAAGFQCQVLPFQFGM